MKICKDGFIEDYLSPGGLFCVKILVKQIKGVEKKTYTFEKHSDETVFLAKNILEGCFIKKVGSLALS